MKIELDILWLDGEQVKLQEMGITTTGQPELKEVTFYQIDNISEYTHDGKPSCVVTSSGIEYVTDLPYACVKGLIDSQL